MSTRLADKKIAIVCDWLKDWWWAEMVTSHIMEMFPHADIFTSIFFQEDNPVFAGRRVYTSFIQKLPVLNRFPKLVPFLRPYAFESFDLSQYDIVISSSSAESKGVITKPETLHICYCHTPTRYFWSHYHEYRDMMEFGWLDMVARMLMPPLVHRLREWDYQASQRPDYFIANADNIARRIKKYYRRDSRVIYPWIETESFSHLKEKKDFYLAVGRVIPYKKFDLLVDAFNANGRRLVIVTNTDNAVFRKLKKRSRENIEWRLNISRGETIRYFEEARAFVFPQEEDFGIVPLEAMSAGTPTIAYKRWGALETVIDGETGIFFQEQTIDSLNDAIERYEQMTFDREILRNHARLFDKKVFQAAMMTFILEKLES